MLVFYKWGSSNKKHGAFYLITINPLQRQQILS